MTARAPFGVLAALLTCYLAAPLVAFAVRLATSSERGFGAPGLFGALYISVVCATISLVLVCLFGIPLAYLLARRPGRVARVVGIAVQLPLALPPLMSGLLLIYLVGPYSFLGSHLGGRLTDSMAGVVLAQSFVAAPFLVVAARAAFVQVDRSLLEVAATLGHGELSRFARVALPAAAPGVRAGMVLCWLRAFGEYGATVILAYHPFTLPIYDFNQFSAAGLPTTQAPVALALGSALVVLAASRLPLARWWQHRRGGQGALGEPTRASVPRLPVASPARVAPPAPLRFSVSAHQGGFALRVSHEAPTGRLAVLGPSGSGKSTLLRALAGLLGPAAAELALGDDRLGDRPPETRGIGYVAQGFDLFPGRQVAGQLAFGVGADAPAAARLAEDLGITALWTRLPSELSGGQRQRVALAQALARTPPLVLLDEPFTGLDAPVRLEARRALRRLQREYGLASVVVTHDPEDAAYLADEIIVLSEGRALQAGAVPTVFAHPASPAVARLLGIPNFAHAVVVEPGVLAIGSGRLVADTGGSSRGSVVAWSVRPEQVELVAPGRGGLAARVLDRTELGVHAEVTLLLEGGIELVARPVGPTAVRAGAEVGLEIPPAAISCWPT
ncbi:MAG: ATP-binding cassette domain-containing protein [Actinomycetota bacterium]|nr:ATP-binding cassette domain-containing protein [Actinomycetota bacterium]